MIETGRGDDRVAIRHPGAPAVGFLFVGGRHQMLHMAPVAAELVRRGEVNVVGFVHDRADERALRAMTPDVEIHTALLPGPFWNWPARAFRRLSKVLRLVGARRQLSAMSILVAAERTSTILKRLPGRRPFMVHIPHGAGDRAQGFEPRIRLFDHVIVAGAKDRNRMIADGLVRPKHCSISGYIKLDAVRAQHEADLPLFANGRPTILYNPHFARKLSSWDIFGKRLIAAFREQDDYNLVVAPHVRLAERLSEAEQAAVKAMAVDGRILIDFGSAKSSNMTYTRGADIYVGDVSSQVYEFLTVPRPCVFLNPGVEHWRGDANYAFWEFGEVVRDPDLAFDAIRAAAVRHPGYVAIQAEATKAALGPMDGSATTRAADILTKLAWEHAAP